MLEVASRRVFWVGGLVLYLVPLLLITLDSEHWGVPAMVGLYALLSLLVLMRFWPKSGGEAVREVVVEREVEVARPSAPEGELEAALRQREKQVEALERQLSQVGAQMEKRRERVSQLEGTVHDLTYEIRTLLKLEEGKNEAPTVRALEHEDESWMEELPDSACQQVRTQYDAYIMLQRCIQKAQRLPGGFTSAEVESSAMELRQLFDSFRDETGAVVVIFSRSEGRLLFANEMVRSFCGWEPERFVREFEGLVRGGRERWQTAIGSLAGGQEAAVRLIVAAASGQSLTLDCCLGVIPSGPFKELVVGVLYRES